MWLRIRRENRLYSNFSGVIDNAETISAVSLTQLKRSETISISAVSMTPLISQTDFTIPFSSFKGKIQRKYFNGKYPHKYLKQKKVGGCLEFIFGFSGVNDTVETGFGDFRRYYLGEYDAVCKTGLAC
jgi:hypothetical protein